MAVDGKLYHVRVESHTVFRYYLHEDWRSVVYEQVSTYEVNGVKGCGIFEFLYRSVIMLLSCYNVYYWSRVLFSAVHLCLCGCLSVQKLKTTDR